MIGIMWPRGFLRVLRAKCWAVERSVMKRLRKGRGFAPNHPEYATRHRASARFRVAAAVPARSKPGPSRGSGVRRLPFLKDSVAAGGQFCDAGQVPYVADVQSCRPMR